ncbi:hypothetical protein GQ53DRAFT_752877 [Thozetella sp. PMI_491]|nr:hypothetical protein GQ53DRAFT_752877 [Thozetella sp. PMI_491]
MCFGKKEDQSTGELGPRPIPSQQPPAYAEAPVKAPQPPSQSLGGPSREAYDPPPGPPPPSSSKKPLADDNYAPPAGPPPPSSKKSALDDYAVPPAGPPPSQMEKPQQDWELAVPDTSLFPPPPDIFSGWDRSPATNATEAQAEAGELWCAQHPMIRPLTLDAPALEALREHNIRLMRPAVGYRGTLDAPARGVWAGKTEKSSGDSCLIGYPPLYAVTEHSPLATDRPKTIYYEVVIKNDSPRDEICLALGYTALPYPAFRMPGWHRGSLAVHGDDGHKYINDRWGGKNFTQPFKRGETYGIGMTFKPTQGRLEVEVFLTRNGRLSDQWNLYEETDQVQDLPVTGLEGFHDLSCAIGTFGWVSFEIVFDPARWAYKGVTL